MKTLEIVFGNSCYYTMKKSDLKNNDILLFNALLNVGDLSNINSYKINIPIKLYNEESNYYFKKEILAMNEAINNGYKIRIWTSHYHIYSYLIMLYICNLINKYYDKLYVIYSDRMSHKYFSPSIMQPNELNELTKFEHKLTQEEILNFSNIWQKIIDINSEMRILENGIVKSVSIDYYDSMILGKLRLLGPIKLSSFVANLMSDIYLIDSLYVYLIDRLIENNKIKIVQKSSTRFFDNVIKIT